MEKIFGVKFPQTTLRKAYGFPWYLRGNLRFDGYATYVKVGDQEFRIAFEYDGIQHEEWIPFFHKYHSQFIKAQNNDLFKDNIVEMDEY